MRTLFNILGPLTNPAGVQAPGARRVQPGAVPAAGRSAAAPGQPSMCWWCTAQDGLDEISLAAPTHVAELKNGEISEYVIQPEDFGIKSQSLIGLTVDGRAGSRWR